ncbi:phospholipase D-like domain-containing protein [Fusobacterium hwasookii]
MEAFFFSQEEVLVDRLSNAKSDVKIAVAWIDFSKYESVFNTLLERGISLYIIINDDQKNHRYDNIISKLIVKGLKIKFFKIIGFGYMHHKFCIIDNQVLINGSFNWTKNANENNFENLLIITCQETIKKFILEFNNLWNLSAEIIKELKYKKICNICENEKIFICALEQEDQYTTRIDFLEICGCSIKIKGTDYCDVSLIILIKDLLINYAYEDDEEYSQTIFLDLQDTLMTLCRKHFDNNTIIHAIGIYSVDNSYENEGERIIRVLWKERYYPKYLGDKILLD